MISMKKGLASLMIVLMAFIIMLGSSFSVAFAADPSGENPAESTTSLEDYVQQNITAINDYGVSFGVSWLNNYFTITDILLVGSQYWSTLHPRLPA